MIDSEKEMKEIDRGIAAISTTAGFYPNACLWHYSRQEKLFEVEGHKHTRTYESYVR